MRTEVVQIVYRYEDEANTESVPLCTIALDDDGHLDGVMGPSMDVTTLARRDTKSLLRNACITGYGYGREES